MGWERKRYKNGKVWVETDDDGNMIVHAGKVKGRYKQEDTRNYSFKADAIRNLDGKVPPSIPASIVGGPPPAPAPTGTTVRIDADEATSPVAALGPASRDFIEIYTDGATSGNPGPSGLGVVMRWGDHYREIHQYIGQGTNNIAELSAIKVGLEAIKNPSRLPVRVYTDSRYAQGVLTKSWKAKANQELISETQAVMRRFPDLEIHWVKGHDGNPLNERVDALARMAVESAKSSAS